jgi:uroporphyrinogen decarboxylase
MRQAGRYLPEYRALRSKVPDFMDFCHNPILACEVTLQPLRRFPLDGAILFSDILVIPKALGQHVWFDGGPKLAGFDEKLFTSSVDNLEKILHRLSYVFEAAERVKGHLDAEFPDVTFLGFSGMPWTLLCYMLEGQKALSPEVGFQVIQRHLLMRPEWVKTCIDALARVVTAYLIKKIESGCEAVQLFESWGGQIPALFVKALSLEPAQMIRSALKKRFPHVPVIFYGRGLSSYYAHISMEKPFAFGVDENVDMMALSKNIDESIPLQGNIHPECLMHEKDSLYKKTDELLNAFKKRPFIMNLGHGIRKETFFQTVEKWIKYIKS